MIGQVIIITTWVSCINIRTADIKLDIIKTVVRKTLVAPTAMKRLILVTTFTFLTFLICIIRMVVMHRVTYKSVNVS
jgi:hypothetical protein